MMTDAGVPDVNFCFGGDEGWIELKHGAQPSRATTVVFKSQRGLEPAQIEWLMYRRKCGGAAFVLTQVGKWLLLHDGLFAPRFNHCTLAELQSAALWQRSGSMREADWAGLVAVLRLGF